jgi:carboxyl-terminal processing protease
VNHATLRARPCRLPRDRRIDRSYTAGSYHHRPARLTRRIHTLFAVLVGAALGAGFMYVRNVVTERHAIVPSKPVLARPEHPLLDEVAEHVRREYVDPVSRGQLEEAAVEGMVASLDPHSEFLDAAAYDEMRVSTAGTYSGVGIEVTEEEGSGRIVVVAPIEGSPADRAGVRAGDALLEVEGKPVAPGSLDQTIARMRGLAGSRVSIVIDRKGEPEPLRFELERSEVHVRTVRAERLPGGYGYVRVSHFSDSTPGDFDGAIVELQAAAGASPLRGLVLDLRDNPGGVLESAVSVADSFLDSGMIVRADGRTPDARFEMDATPGDLLHGAPVVVLVDGGSASGAEIVAGALRDHGRATLMGERTYGKGSVQTVMPLRDGEALKLTTSRYFTPSGRSIQARGLEPDVRVAMPPDEAHRDYGRDAGTDPEVRSALQYLRDRSLGTHVALATKR